ncbi:uncharacterized protein [Asterias amurensis]|uniref:uncharacterized protein n=1 Tax=Asterias amurensis TaxID=7602 RepID=UPI003AB3F1ED
MSRYSRMDIGLTVKEDRALQRNSFARRHLDANLEVQQSMEKMHLQTIRNEKMKLQRELEKMRGRGRGNQRILGRRHTASMSSNTARLTQLRLNKDPNERFKGQGQSFNGGNRSLKISGRATSPTPGATGEPNTARAPMEAVGRGRHHTVELPSIIPGGRSPRSGYHNRQEPGGEDYIREQHMLEHKRNLNKKQEELQARMEKFGDDLGQKHRDTTTNGETRRSPSERSDTKSDDGITVSSDPSASFPPSQPHSTDTPLSSRQRSNSFSEYDLKSVKNSITKRLVGDEKTPTDPTDASTTESPQFNRTTSTVSSVTGNAKLRKKKTSVGSDSKQKGIPLNFDMVFDQDTYAPDGSLRTMHMLPDPMETFEEAKKARYLRWRGPKEDDIELTVNQIFGKAESSLTRKDSV